MVSSPTGSSALSALRSGIIAEINTMIKISLTDLPKEESTPLKMKMLRLMTDLRKLSEKPPAEETSEEKAELDMLKKRVSNWSQAPAAAPTTAAAAGVLRAGASAAPAPELARVDPVVANETYEKVVARFGPKGICMPYIIDQTSILAKTIGIDPKCIELLNDALWIYEVNPEEASTRFAAFFDHMVASITVATGQLPEIIFEFGKQASHARRLDLLFKPVDELAPEIIGAMRPSEAEAAFAREEVFDEAYLRKCFKEGTDAAYHLGFVGYNLSCTFIGILQPALVPACHYVNPETFKLYQKAEKQNRLDVTRRIKTSPLYAKIPEAFRVSAYLKISLMDRQLIEVEKQLSKTFQDCEDFFCESRPFISSLYKKLAALDGKTATPETSAQKFALVAENYPQIKLFSKTFIAYLEEICDGLEATLKTRTYTCYLNVLSFAPEVEDWERLRDGDAFSFLDDYIAAHPHLNLDLLPIPELRKTTKKTLQLISKTHRTIAFLKACLATFKTLEQGVSSEHMDAFIRLGALYKAGLISVRATGELVMGPLSSYRPSLEDGLGDEVSLPPLPASLGAARAAARVATAAATPTALVAEEATEEPPAAASAEEAPAAFPASPTSEEYRRLASLLEVAKAHSRFTSKPAKEAFQNALYYAGVLNTLLSEFKGELFKSTQLASLQQDIGTAAFYAYEQLLTAIVLEKESTVPPAELFETLEHRLMDRLFKGNLVYQAEKSGITSVIKELEGMGNAVKDLSRAYPVPNLLQRTLQLISKGDSPASSDEQADTMVRGQAALRGFFTLLYSGCLHKEHIPPGHKAMFARAAEKPPEPSSDGIGGGAAAAAAASKAVTGGGGGGGGGGRGAAASRVVRGGGAGGAAAAAASKAVTGGGGGGAPLPFKSGEVQNLAGLIHRALDRSSTYEAAERRRSCLNHNLRRLDYLRSCLEEPSKRPLFSFYASQAQYVLTILMEEFLCAACESQIGFVNQAEVKHDLKKLAEQIKIFTKLTGKEQEFLAQSAGNRNKFRYKHTFERPAAGAPVGGGAAAAAAAEPADGDEGGFVEVLSTFRAKRLGTLDAEIAMTLALCRQVAKHSFAT